MESLLKISNLKVSFYLNGHSVNAVEDASLEIFKNEVLVLAGESGSGKTVTALAITNILPKNARIVSGSIDFCGQDLAKLGEQFLSGMRGKEIAYIFQEPTSFLNPVYTVGNQIIEAIMLHQNKNEKEAYKEALELLNQVKIKEPHRVLLNYPHQLSGGMNQRAFIAMSLACRPKLLIADEPTTSLDVTIEAQILNLLTDLKNKLGFSILFITHNLSIAKRIADRICIMYRGRTVEQGNPGSIFNSAEHFHTKELVNAYYKIGRI